MGAEEELSCVMEGKKKDKMLCVWIIKLTMINIFHKEQLKHLQQEKY